MSKNFFLPNSIKNIIFIDDIYTTKKKYIVNNKSVIVVIEHNIFIIFCIII